VALAGVVGLLALPGSAMAFEPLSSIGSFGLSEEAGTFSRPAEVRVAPDGNLYAADEGRVDVFAPGGSFLFAFGKGVNSSGTGNPDICTTACQGGSGDGSAGSLYAATGLALDGAGLVFVSEYNGNRVDAFTTGGEFVRAFGWGVMDGANEFQICTAETECVEATAGDDPGALSAPVGLDIGGDGLLYVADPGNDRIDVFAPSGEFVRAFGKEVNPSESSDVCTTATGCQAAAVNGEAGAIDNPHDVALSAAGEAAVTDSGNHRIDIFTAAGEFVRAFGKEVNSSDNTDFCTTECQTGAGGAARGAIDNPQSLAFDAAGDFYVTDVTMNRVEEFDPSGAFIRAFGEGVIDHANEFQICTTTCVQGLSSESPGSTAGPEGVAVDCRGAVYVSEFEWSAEIVRVERFGEPGTALPPCPPEPAPAPISAPAPTSNPPSNNFRFVGLKLNRGNGAAVLFVKVPAAGRLSLYGRGVRSLTRRARRARRVALPIRPKTPLKRYLKRHGKAKIRVKVTFQPFGGTPRTREKQIVLRRRRHHR
jgi:hypothetical protein